MGVVERLDRGVDVVSRRFRAPDVLEMRLICLILSCAD